MHVHVPGAHAIETKAPQKDLQAFHLQNLPQELRLQVYASVFEGATVTATVVRHRGAAATIRFAHSPHSHLLFACREIKDEAHRGFWSTAVLRARSVDGGRPGAGGALRRHLHAHACLSELAALIPPEIASVVRHMRCVKVCARLAGENPRYMDHFPALKTISLLEGEDCAVSRVPTSHLDGTPLAVSPLQFQWHSWDGIWSEGTFFRFRSWLADGGAEGIDPREVLAQKYGIKSLLDENTTLQCVGVDSFLKFPTGMYGFAYVVRKTLTGCGQEVDGSKPYVVIPANIVQNV